MLNLGFTCYTYGAKEKGALWTRSRPWNCNRTDARLDPLRFTIILSVVASGKSYQSISVWMPSVSCEHYCIALMCQQSVYLTVVVNAGRWFCCWPFFFCLARPITYSDCWRFCCWCWRIALDCRYSLAQWDARVACMNHLYVCVPMVCTSSRRVECH